ncbi:MAG: hypothetical protein VB088_10585 [Sphaerochaeta sp.]|uniref:hypothetical protein n=1 Tax=Sphaerochaeta associata TaxID=1129264 RepID=UPI000EDE6325|nr:hypothetical protein [Sphaerochaeta associata]MEA4865831.1 hypothetical protein [Sphaerochaeta sp.]MEA5028037.1 hypothetical protein [Sphaerochaeta associata]HAP56816.1 hypothetical protein [Sphaerochaeta sp.]
MKRIMLCCLLSLSVLWASDLVVLTDGSMHIGRIVRYEADKALLFEDLKGNQIVYTKGEILVTRTNIDAESLIAVDWNRIVYHSRQRGGAYEVSPRYTYKGQTYTMETGWGRESEVLQFFDLLKTQELDEQTRGLITELERAMKKQSTWMQTGLLTELAGLTMMLTPLFLMNDSVELPTTPTWAAWTGVAGLGVNIAGLGILISQLFVNHDHYLPRIADSYNSNVR